MSIYASMLDIDDTEHTLECEVYERIGPVPDLMTVADDSDLLTRDEGGQTIAYSRVARPCTCNNPAPIIYQGSHVNPAGDHPRGGSVDIAAIPNHCHPDVRGTGSEDGPPVEFLRLSVEQDAATYGGNHPGLAAVVLDRTQAEKIHVVLGEWLGTDQRW